MDSRRPCQRCGLKLFDREATTMWCGRHFPWFPERPGCDVHERQEYVIVLCRGCTELVWPAVRDSVLTIGRADRPPA